MAREKYTKLDTPDSLRAYAHPIRMRIVGLLRSEGPLTASQLGERLDESSGSTSYHLRQLARFGIVEEAGGGKGREKPWRAVSQVTQFPSTENTEELAEAATDLRLSIARRWNEVLTEWIIRRAGEPKRWQRAPFSDYGIHVTAAELADIEKRIEQILQPYMLERSEQNRPRGARLVYFVTYGAPR
jgi:DNA-binding transcriptional ArsR family regulator